MNNLSIIFLYSFLVSMLLSSTIVMAEEEKYAKESAWLYIKENRKDYLKRILPTEDDLRIESFYDTENPKVCAVDTENLSGTIYSFWANPHLDLSTIGVAIFQNKTTNEEYVYVGETWNSTKNCITHYPDFSLLSSYDDGNNDQYVTLINSDGKIFRISYKTRLFFSKLTYNNEVYYCSFEINIHDSSVHHDRNDSKYDCYLASSSGFIPQYQINEPLFALQALRYIRNTTPEFAFRYNTEKIYREKLQSILSAYSADKEKRAFFETEMNTLLKEWKVIKGENKHEHIDQQ